MSFTNFISQIGAAGGGPEGAWDLSYAYYDPVFVWDVSTGLYTGKSFSVSSQTSYPSAVFFKPDGTKMYVADYNITQVHEYNLSTAWDVDTASYNQSSATINGTRGLSFKSDGTKMYIQTSSARLYEYNLSTAWDVSTASYLQNFNSSAEGTSTWGVYFKPDGTKVYLTEDGGNEINEYNLSTAWDVSTASYVQTFGIGTQEASPRAVYFKSDGTKMYVMGTSGDDVNEYDLSTAWDISTASFSQLFSISTQETIPHGLYFEPNGASFYIVGASSDTVYKYALGGFIVAAQETQPEGLFFKPDGTKMYIIGVIGDDVNEYDLSTAWDVSTASYLQNFSVAAQDTKPTELFFKPDGLKMYILGDAGDDINEYDLSIAWDVSSASYLQNFSVSAQEAVPKGLFFRPDGLKMYVVGRSTSDSVYEYDLSTAWDVSSASYLQNFNVAAQDTSPVGVFFKPDGLKMYVVGLIGDAVYEYDLSTAWDISTASYLQNFSVAAQEGSPRGPFFKEDGTQMFIVDAGTDRVYSYTLGPQD